MAQNVFLQVFRCLGQYRNDARFETWLYRLTVNEALQYRRRNRRWPFPSLNEELVTGTQGGALCGQVWVHSRRPGEFPVCAGCKESGESMRSGDDELGRRCPTP